MTENTISSLKMAGNHGADYVEFDVQLTKDHVPIVYHNFLVCTTLAREGFFSGELYAMQVKDLTLQQLQSLKLDHSSVMETPSTRIVWLCVLLLGVCVSTWNVYEVC